MSLAAKFVQIVHETTGVQRANLRSGLDLVREIRAGLPAESVEKFVRAGKLSNAEVDRIILPRKTLAHRKEIGKLTADQSDRLMRVARVIAFAEETFGDEGKAHLWLRRPTSVLGNSAPVDLLDTEEGAREVETVLARIAHGIAA
jgi:putative toxin-antitoxin system antitoxin component (TIGR02293 family)